MANPAPWMKEAAEEIDELHNLTDEHDADVAAIIARHAPSENRVVSGNTALDTPKGCPWNQYSIEQVRELVEAARAVSECGYEPCEGIPCSPKEAERLSVALKPFARSTSGSM